MCYYKCASFPLLCFYSIGKIYYSVLYNIFSHYIDFLLLIQSRSNIKGDSGIKFTLFCFSGNICKACDLWYVTFTVGLANTDSRTRQLETRCQQQVFAGPSPDSPSLPRSLRGKGKSRNITETKPVLLPASPHSEKLAMNHKRNDILLLLPQNNFYLLPNFVCGFEQTVSLDFLNGFHVREKTFVSSLTKVLILSRILSSFPS